MILRGLSGLIIGIGYGLLVGAVTFLSWRLTHDPALPGPMIPNLNEWGRIVTLFATVIGGVCGALVGMVVALAGLNKTRGGLIGAGLGLVFFFFLSADLWRDALTMSWRDLPAWLGLIAIFLFCLPVGLGLVGMTASMIASKLKP